jgi:hypothetical protein
MDETGDASNQLRAVTGRRINQIATVSDRRSVAFALNLPHRARMSDRE